MPPDIFEEYLEQKNFSFYSSTVEAGKVIFCMDSYRIQSGRRAGGTVGVGLPIPVDFPDTAPYGVHVKKDHGFKGSIPNENPSPLGSDWSFWSRQANWEAGRRTAQYYMDQVDGWLGAGG